MLDMGDRRSLELEGGLDRLDTGIIGHPSVVDRLGESSDLLLHQQRLLCLLVGVAGFQIRGLQISLTSDTICYRPIYPRGSERG